MCVLSVTGDKDTIFPDKSYRPCSFNPCLIQPCYPRHFPFN